MPISPSKIDPQFGGGAGAEAEYRLDLARLDCDPALFDKDAFLTDLLQHANYAQVHQVRETLLADCKRLECAQKSMVHENYSKFIDISDKTHQLAVNMQDNIQVLQELLAVVREIREDGISSRPSLNNKSEAEGH